MGIRTRGEPPRFTEAERKLLQVSSAVDQVLTLAEEAMRANPANRPLVDLALDVQNALRAVR